MAVYKGWMRRRAPIIKKMVASAVALSTTVGVCDTPISTERVSGISEAGKRGIDFVM